jgi:cytochrome c oxidase assembly factor CtaG
VGAVLRAWTQSICWGVLYVFTTAIHTGVLGALLTFAPHAWYPAYQMTTPAWGLTPLEDQQIGGLIMWVPGSLVYIVAGLGLFAGWLKQSEAMVANKGTMAGYPAPGRTYDHA